METLAFALLLAAAAAAFVALPALRSSARSSEHLQRLGDERMLHLGLIEGRDRALAALRELEFDHHTGKVSDVDYRELIGPLRLEAADSLRSLDDAGLGAVRAASARRRSGRQRARRKEDPLLVGSSAATPTLFREKHS